MELFIQIRDGQPFEHPIFADNFAQAFPDIDTANLPSSFARFVRIEPPSVGIYEVYDGVTYEWQNGVVTDVHHVRPMTSSEVLEKQNTAKAFWAEHGFASWVFDEENCSFNSPIPYPGDGELYTWDESVGNWVAIPIASEGPGN